MATAVDICNVALSRLGDRASLTSIDPPEGSMQADNCARFYPMARDSALEHCHWTFARTRAPLAQVNTPVFSYWQYVYALPADFLRLAGVLSQGCTLPFGSVTLVPYFLATLPNGERVLATNQPNAWLDYSRRVVDPALFPPLFASAVSYLLASHLAGPLIKGVAGARTMAAMQQAYAVEVAKAAVADANQDTLSHASAHTPASVRARGHIAGSRVHEHADGLLSWPVA